MERLESLDQRECHSLLATHSMGRVAFTQHALPAIRPVNYTLQGTHIVLRTRADGLAAQLDGQVVAFEIDDVDADTESGWSVVVTGTARVVRETTDLVGARRAVPLPARTPRRLASRRVLGRPRPPHRCLHHARSGDRATALAAHRRGLKEDERGRRAAGSPVTGRADGPAGPVGDQQRPHRRTDLEMDVTGYGAGTFSLLVI